MRESRTRQETETEPSTWSTDDDDVMRTPLPEAMQVALETLFGGASISTLEEWVEAIRTHVDGTSFGIEDLCHASEPTGHRAEVAGDTYHFMCFYDAVVLAALAETSVEIMTRSPNGTDIEATAIGGESLTVTPDDVVTSFGVASQANRSAGQSPSVEDLYRAVCPSVKAFPDRAAYSNWAADHEVPTVGIPLGDAIEIATALAEDTS